MLLEAGPEEAGVIIEVAGEFGADVALFAAKLILVEAGLSDREALEFENAVPLEVGALAFVADRIIGGPSVVVGAVFGEVGLESLLAAVFGVGAEGEVLHDVGDFVDLGAFGVAHTGTELEFRAHDAGPWDVDQKSFGAGSEFDLFGGMFYRRFPFFLFWRCCFLCLRAWLRAWPLVAPC